MKSLLATRELLRGIPGDSVLVGLSGGKDSLVVLDLCKQRFPRVECFFLYIVRGLRFAELPVESAARRYGVKVHYLPSPGVADFLRTGECRFHLNRKVPQIKQVDVELALRERTGIEWIAGGHRMTDSLHRRGMLHRCAGVDKNGRRVYPIWDWAPRDVHAYLRARGLCIPAAGGAEKGARSSGVNLRAETLRWIKREHPDDYEKILKVFPFAGAQLAGVEADTAAEVHDAAGVAQSDPGR